MNTMLHGPNDTPMADVLLHTEGKHRMARNIPTESCKEIASVVLELVANGHLPGTEIRVDVSRTVGP